MREKDGHKFPDLLVNGYGGGSSLSAKVHKVLFEAIFLFFFFCRSSKSSIVPVISVPEMDMHLKYCTQNPFPGMVYCPIEFGQ